MAKDKRKHRKRFTKRQQKIMKEKAAEREILAKKKFTNEERLEVEFLKVERKLQEKSDRIKNWCSAIRGNYLTLDQKEKVLQEIKKQILISRELLRKVYGMNYIFLKGKSEKKRKKRI